MNSTRADGRRFWLSRRFTGAPVGANGHNAVGHRGAFRHPLHAALSLKMIFPKGLSGQAEAALYSFTGAFLPFLRSDTGEIQKNFMAPFRYNYGAGLILVAFQVQRRPYDGKSDDF